MSPECRVVVLRRTCAALLTTTLLTTAAVAVPASAPAAQAAIPVPSPIVDGMGGSATTDPADLRVLVNKAHPLTPREWRPERLTRPDVRATGANDRLRPVAARALERLAAAAERATGQELVLVSGFRDAEAQQELYRQYVERDGRKAADTYSARGGHSEHQTGLAADVAQAGTPYTRFGTTKTGRWVEDHAWRYGFVVRYPRGAQKVTGYAPEAWHLRYVGVGLAAHMHVAGVATLEEASGTGPAPDYAKPD